MNKMTKTRLISIAAAVLIAITIMLMGKACTNSILESNKKAREKHAELVAAEKSNYAPTHDFSDRVIQTYPPDETETTGESTSDESVEYITGILGGVIGTVPQTTAPSGNTPPDASADPALDAPDPTKPNKYQILDNNNSNGNTNEQSTGNTQISTVNINDMVINVN